MKSSAESFGPDGIKTSHRISLKYFIVYFLPACCTVAGAGYLFNQVFLHR